MAIGLGRPRGRLGDPNRSMALGLGRGHRGTSLGVGLQRVGAGHGHEPTALTLLETAARLEVFHDICQWDVKSSWPAVIAVVAVPHLCRIRDALRSPRVS